MGKSFAGLLNECGLQLKLYSFATLDWSLRFSEPLHARFDVATVEILFVDGMVALGTCLDVKRHTSPAAGYRLANASAAFWSQKLVC